MRIITFSLVLLGLSGTIAADTRIQIDGQGSGRVFDGIGGLSAGASSRLLIDYPEPQRGEILDYLFKPSFGAALHILRVEIGGGANSTDGSEASHEPLRGQEDYKRGYEWWLMKEAKARNPDIKLAALAWTAPGWVGNGNYWNQDCIDYHIRWLQHAKSDYGLAMDYMGGWNEKGFDATWFINFKKAMRAGGFSAKLIGSDEVGWNIFTAMQGNSAFMDAVDIVGSHYPCDRQSGLTTCASPDAPRQSGKTLWDSEDGSRGYNDGATYVAKSINRDYIDGKMTAFINWSLIWSAYEGMAYSGSGLMLANSPWSGHYEVGKSIWAVAHTTQFAKPGWQYLDNACGFLANNRNVGSFVTLKSPTGSDYSIVVETVDASADEPFTFTPSADLASGPVHAWRTDLSSSNPADYFVKQPDAQPSNGSYTLTLKRGCVYTFTTTTGQVMGSTTPPAAKTMAIPYYDTFEKCDTQSREAPYFSDLCGTFVAAPCAGGRAGTCLAQVVPAAPISWAAFSQVCSMIGDPGWTDYQVQSDVLLPQPGAVQVMGRLCNYTNNSARVPGYVMQASDDGSWRLFLSSSGSTKDLAAGKTAFKTGTWHTLRIVFQGQNIEGWIDGAKVASARDGTYAKGNAGIGVDGWTPAQFDNFSVTPPGSVITSADPAPRNERRVYPGISKTAGFLTLSNPSAVPIFARFYSIDGRLCRSVTAGANKTERIAAKGLPAVYVVTIWAGDRNIAEKRMFYR